MRMIFFMDVCPQLTYNVLQAGVVFLLVQLMYLSVNTQKITLACCYVVVRFILLPLNSSTFKFISYSV